MRSLSSDVRTLMARVLGFEEQEIVPDAHLEDDLGLNAYDLIELAVALESAFDVKLDWADLGSARNVADIERHLEGVRELCQIQRVATSEARNGVARGRRRPRHRELRMRFRNESALRRALSQLLEQDLLDDCLVDVPAGLVHARSAGTQPRRRG
jgi:acyl carrier protein